MPVFEVQDPRGRTLQIDGDHEPSVSELEDIFTAAYPEPTLSTAVPAPGETRVQRAGPVINTLGTFPSPREEETQIAIANEPTAEELKDVAARTPTVQLGQTATIPQFGEPGTVARGFSDVLSGLGEFVLNRPEEVVASLYPPTAAAIGLRYGIPLGKQWLEDVYNGIKGDRQAAGRAAAMLAAVGGPVAVKRGIGAVKSANADIAYQAQYRALVDRMAREGLSQTVGERQTPFAQFTMEQAPGREVLTPKARELTEDEAQRLILAPEDQRAAAEIAAAERPALLPESAAELEKFTGEENKPPAAALRETPETQAPTTATVSQAESGGVTAPLEPSAISQATTEGQKPQASVTEPSPAAPDEPTPAPSAKARKGVERPWDIIDEIGQSVGKIRRKSAAKPGTEGYYTPEFTDLAKSGASRDIFSDTGQSPDEALDTLRRSGFMGPDATVDDLRIAIEKAKANRTAIFRGETPEAKADKFQVALKNQGAKRATQIISVGDLAVGEKFKIQGEQFEVVSIDPDTGEVTVKDGRKFGAQTIPDGADVPIEQGSLKTVPKPTTFVPKVRASEKGTGELFQGEDQPFNLVGEKAEFVPPKTETTQFGGETLTQNELFAIQKVVQDVDPTKSANVAQQLYGGPQKAAQVIRRQLSVMDSDPKVKKDFSREQRARLKEVLNLLEQRASEPPAQGPGMVGMGGATYEEFTGSGTATAMKYRKIDEERIQRGLEPLTKPMGRTDQEVWDRAMAAIDADPGLPDRLISELRGKARPITDLENHVLLLRKIDLRNDYGRATRDIAQAFDDGREQDLVAAKSRRAELSDKLTELEEASRVSGSERGRALRSLRVMADEEFNLAAMESDMRAAVGGRRLTPEETSQVERIKKEYDAKTAALDKQLQESERRRVEAETRATLAEVGRQAAEVSKPPSHIMRIVEKIGQVLHTRADAARARLRGKLFTLSPEVLKDLAEVGADNIFTVGEDLAKWSAKMIEDIGEHVRPHLQAVWEAAKKLYDDTIEATVGAGAKKPSRPKDIELAKQTIKKGDTPDQRVSKLTARIKAKIDEGKPTEITPQIQRLARAFVEQGIADREELIDAVHEVVSRIAPGWTRRETMDAISGYGDYKTLTKDEISVKLRDLKGQMQQIAKLEDMASGQAPLRTGLERRVPTRAESELIKLVNEAKRKGGYETTDPEKQLRTALDEVKKRTETAILDYEKRIREEDFAVRKLSPVRPDDELLSAQANLKRIRKQWEQLKRQKELDNRQRWQKVLDRFVRWERAFKLSSPVVFGKLTAAAITRVATTGTEEAVGAGLGLVPGIRTVAKQAPREGGINAKAMAKALTQAVTKGLKDASQTLTKGAADIDVEFGEKLIDRDWVNVFGQLHGMLKAPVKRAEFELSLQKRIEFNLRNGVDVTNPLVMTRLQTEALNDGYRAIFMQRGLTSDAFNFVVNWLEKAKKPGYQPSGEILARTARFLMPVVRVPMNIVAETATGVYGAPLASARTMLEISRGTLSKLDPAVADSIMRQWKKGSIGLGLMAIGYFTPEMVGGYDWREKRLPGAVKTAGFQVGGANIPRWMTHAPWFELMQIGATIRHVKDQHVKGEAKGIGEGLWAAGLGLLEETPFIGQMVRMDKMFEGSAARTQYLGELMKGTLVPQLLNQVAQATDRRFGQSVKRKPTNIWQHVEMGVPGLRQNVPVATK